MTGAKGGGLILVTGATGTVGRDVLRHLIAAGQPVRAAVRDPDRAEVPSPAGVVRLDFSDPATVGPALAGVDRIFLMRPPAVSDVRAAFGPLVSAAAELGVRRVVALSVMGVNPALPHWRMERMVRAAGLSMTAVRPAYFDQNLITAFGDDIRERSELPLASGHGRVSFVDTRDVAEVAARVLSDPDRHPAGALTLTGPRAVTFTEAATLLSAELGRPVRYLDQTFWRRRTDLRARGLDPAYVRVQLIIDLTTRIGLASRVTHDVEHVLGRPARSLREFIHDHRDAWSPQHDR